MLTLVSLDVHMQSRIGHAIIPLAAFVATPQIPPPPRQVLYSRSGLSSAVVRSSLLSQLFSTPEPPVSDADSFTDDSSWGDYDGDLAEWQNEQTG